MLDIIPPRKNDMEATLGSLPRGQAAPNRLSQSPIHLLHRASQCAADIFASAIMPGDLTPRQYAVLLTIANEEGLSQTDLVARTGIDRSTLADIVRRMSERNLLQRQRTKEDARAYSVRLTEKGRSALMAAEPVAMRIDQQILAALPANERQVFLQALSRLTGDLDANNAQQGPQPQPQSQAMQA
jgi:MarR family transcriptional regulator, temperature-dependent positive regulator of motility